MKNHRRALVIIAGGTALVGALAAFALAAGLPDRDRTFATVAVPVQLLLSVGTPFLGAVATSTLQEQPRRLARETIVRSVGWAIGFAVFGSVVTAIAVGVLPSGAPEGRWVHGEPALFGSLLVHVVAMLTGTGFGLLLRRPVLASLATVVVPLALWLLLVGVAPGARLWFTPLEGANLLLAGTMTSSEWLPYLVMVCLWGVGLNAAGLRRLDQVVDGRTRGPFAGPWRGRWESAGGPPTLARPWGHLLRRDRGRFMTAAPRSSTTHEKTRALAGTAPLVRRRRRDDASPSSARP